MSATLDFRCCDTTWRIGASGRDAKGAVEHAREVALGLEARLNAFAPQSRVAVLNRDGRVVDADIARIVVRAEEYRQATGGAFDVARGALEHAIKTFIRGGPLVLDDGRRACYQVKGQEVVTSAPLDLNGIAKGYIVDQAHAALVRAGVAGFVDGGGDITGATGPVGIESPADPAKTIGVLDTRWSIATSGRSKRRRGKVDHIYDPRDGRIGARHDQVTVVARRDCTEADVLATTLAMLPLQEGLALVEDWRGVEALWIDGEDMIASAGFADHVLEA